MGKVYLHPEENSILNAIEELILKAKSRGTESFELIRDEVRTLLGEEDPHKKAMNQAVSGLSESERKILGL